MTIGVALECMVCGGELDVPTNVMMGELVDCGDCGSELEVVGLQPAIQFQEAPMAAEDWGE